MLLHDQNAQRGEYTATMECIFLLAGYFPVNRMPQLSPDIQ
jgi:hypothetical protein